MLAALEGHRTIEFADLSVDELSAGSAARAWIAMALAQGTDILLLDEPTMSSTSPTRSRSSISCRSSTRAGAPSCAVLHDLNLACRYARHLVAMKAGRIVVEGPPDEVITVDTVAEVFGLDSMVVPDPVCGSPMVVPIGRHNRGLDPDPDTDPVATDAR